MNRTDTTARNDVAGDGVPSGPTVEWHLARDGRQYGPVTAAEIAKLVELGHLQDGDLVWRSGFTDWRPISEVRSEILPQRNSVTVETLPPYTSAQQPDRRTQPETARSTREPSSSNDGWADINAASVNDTTDAMLRHAQQHAQTQQPGSATGYAAPGPQPIHHGADWKERLDALASRDYDAPIGGADAGHGQMRADIGTSHRDPRISDPANRRTQGAGEPDHGADPRYGDPRFPDARFSDAQPVGRANYRGQPDPRLHDPPTASDPRTRDARARQQTPVNYRAPTPEPDPRYAQPAGPAAVSANGRRPAPEPRPQTPSEMMLPQHGHELDDSEENDEPPRRRGLMRTLVAVLLLGSIGAGTGYAYMNRATLIEMFETTFSKDSETAAAGKIQTPSRTSEPARSDKNQAGGLPSIERRTAAASGDTSDTADKRVMGMQQPGQPSGNGQGLMETPLWASITSQFPDWAAGQRTEVAKLRDQRVPEDTIDGRVMEAIVDLRRKNASDALASPDEHVVALAAAFLANLKALASKSTDACYGFISRGETSPAVLPLISRDSAISAPVLAQLDVVMSAIAAGKKQPVQYVTPFSSDYTVLSEELKKRGWSNGDLELFSNPQALSTATPDQVCRLVTGWFEAQLGIPKKDIQLRLLRQSLRPVVSG